MPAGAFVARALIAAAAASALFIDRAGAQTTLSIEKLSPEGYRLHIAGPDGWTHLLEKTDHLAAPQWETIGIGTAGSTGLTLDDFPPPGATARFYRARSSSVRATTSSANGNEDEALTISLEGADVADTSAARQLTATILSLPDAGTLSQFDGTVITAVPVQVTDEQRRVRLQGAPHANGNPYASFNYKLANANTTAESFPTEVQVALAPVPDPPAVGIATPVAVEDTPKLIQLHYTDPDLGREGDSIQLFILFTTLTGDLYQVEPDDITRSALIQDGDRVTNPSGFILYQPPPDVHGEPLTSFQYTAQDQYGLTAVSPAIEIDVVAANDAPTANSRTHHGFNDVVITSIALDTADADDDALQVCFTAIDSTLAIYKNVAFTPENKVAAGTCIPHGSLRIITYSSEDDYEGLTRCGPSVGTFSYYATDGSANSATVTDTLSRACRNYFPDPRTSPKRADTTQETAVEIVLRAVDPDGNSDEQLFMIESLPAHGQLSLPSGFQSTSVPYPLPLSDAATGWKVIYLPESGYTNTENTLDAFSYSVTDEEGLQYPFLRSVGIRVAPGAP